MKIYFKNFLRQNHSWAIVTQNLARNLTQDHDVSMYPTDEGKCYPSDLEPYLKNKPEQYDVAISYTAMHNFQKYLSMGKKKLGIWCSETNYIPQNFIAYSKYADLILPPSNWSKDIFIKNGVSKDKLKVIPHGYSYNDNVIPYDLGTNKKCKFLMVLGQLHYRKGIDLILESIGRTFTNKDDVCFVFKVALKSPSKPFEIDFNIEINKFKKKFPNHPEIKIIHNFIEDLSSLYKACNISYSLSRGEAFHIPSLDGLVANHIVISPNYGGALDFLNKDNSVLIEGKLNRVPLIYQYWQPSPKAEMFEINLDDACNKLKYVVDNFDNLKFNINDVKEKFSWKNAAKELEKCFQ